MDTFIFHVQGTHCKSCKIMIEEELNEVPFVQKVTVHLAKQRVEVSGDFKGRSIEAVMDELNPILKPHGYCLSLEAVSTAKWSELGTALPLAGVFILLFLMLQKVGIVNWISSSEVNYSTAFLVGVVASLSTCMAVVGGLVLSISANFARGGDRVKPQALFHVGRLVSFFVLGGVLGLLGDAIEIGKNSTVVLNLLVGIVMVILGLNLLELFPSLRALQPTLPRFFSRSVRSVQNINHTLTPLALGILTFFLPCGFTQSMQIFSLSSGSFWTGSFTMLTFALGTLPVLALLSFGFSGLKDKKMSGVFFKAAGFVVLFFAALNILSACVALGLLPPFLTF